MSRKLKQLHFDENNLPILRPCEIEERAEVLLDQTSPESLLGVKATDLHGIIDRLKEWNIRFILDEALAHTSDGRKVRGRINIQQKTVWIDSELQQEIPNHRFNFTVAHEIGHLALHRHRPIRNYDAHDDTDKELRMEFTHATSARGRAEWQANRYAAALLMPREMVRLAIIKCQTERDNPIKVNIGYVYLDDSRTNRQLYVETLSYLSQVYQVSRTVVRIRLEELGHLIDKRDRIHSIGEILGDMMV